MAQKLRDLDNVKTFPDVNAGISVPKPPSRPGPPTAPGSRQATSSSGNGRNSKSGSRKGHQRSVSPRSPSKGEQRLQLPGLMKVVKPPTGGSRQGSEQAAPLIGFNASGLKMDTMEPVTSLLAGSGSLVNNTATLSQVDVNKQNSALGKKKPQDPVTAQLRTYATLMDQYSLHNIIVWNGKALRNTPEFASFQRSNLEIWSNIVTVLSLLEAFLADSQVKMAVVSGQKVAELAILNLPYTSKRELMNCVVNEDQVRSQMIRGSGDDEFDKIRAIVRIQNAGRRILAMKSVREMRQKIAAAIVIQCIARKMISKLRLQALSKNSFQLYDTVWTSNQEKLRKSYGSIQAGQSRLIIYLPSISAAEYLRINMDSVNIHQNAHVAIFHQLLNPDVNIIYISPQAPTAQLLAFHEKLLLLLGAPEGSIRRLRVITPELSLRLPEHIPVGHALWYSGATLRKLRSITKRYDHSVFVPASMSYIEKRIANFLGIGSLSPDPTMGGILSSRSHARRVFIDAQVNVPIGAHDIETEEDLLVALARLIACNLDIDRWFIRLNSDFNGESLAIVDCSKMPVVRSLREEQAALVQANHNNVLVWFEHRIQMNARKRVAGSFHHHHMKQIEVIRQDLYPSWHSYAGKIRTFGCLIEAEPPCAMAVLECVCLLEPKPSAAVSTAVSRSNSMMDIDEEEFNSEQVTKAAGKRRGGVNAAAEFPGVNIRLLETHSKLVDEFGQVQGSIYPQPLHIHHESVKGATHSVCSALWEKIQCIGYVTIRFLASWDHTDQIVRLLGTELSFGLSPLVSAICTNWALRVMSSSGAISSMMKTGRLQAPSELQPDVASPENTGHLTAATFAETPFFKFGGSTKTNTSHFFNSPNPIWSPTGHSEGSYLYLPAIFHAPLRSCRDDVFFKLCKLNNVAYDPVHQTGVMFFLVDSVSSGQLSMLVVGGIEGKEDSKLLHAESTEGRQYHPPALRARLNTLQLAVNALLFISRSFGKDVELIDSAGFEGGNSAGGVYNGKSSDQAAARAFNSLSSVLMSLKKTLKKEQKIAELLSSQNNSKTIKVQKL